MRSAAVLALLFCAGQVIALPVNSPMNKGDTEVMKCIVEVISDTLSKPSPMPVSQECFETLRGDERILSILRHQNLLKELQDLALQGAKERAHQKKHSGLEDGLSEALEKQNDQAELKEVTEEASSKDAAEKRGDSKETEKNDGDTDGARPQASLEPEQGSKVEEDNQAPGEQEASNAHPPASLPSQKHSGPQAQGDRGSLSQGPVDREKGLGVEQEQQAKREEEEEEEEDTEAGEKAVPEEEGPTAAFNPHPSLGYKETQRDERPGAGKPVGHRGRAGEGGPPAAGTAPGLTRQPAPPSQGPEAPSSPGSPVPFAGPGQTARALLLVERPLPARPSPGHPVAPSLLPFCSGFQPQCAPLRGTPPTTLNGYLLSGHRQLSRSFLSIVRAIGHNCNNF
ncbi:chromogranin-A isoform X2 [Panthera uncia]|uniref:chromogranin-A isoform X2 n=1 Tax=Panthera uncia TaxID=29064 RepID=UPI0020FF8BA7|nr:chromogranin-A isoform X2 [Panthera uncia]